MDANRPTAKSIEIPVFTVSGDTRPLIIKKVKQAWGWMGNMAPFGVEYDGQHWPSTEALFQALRFAPDDPIRAAIRSAGTAFEAKQVALSNACSMIIAPRSSEDLDHMRMVLRLKIDQNEAVLRDRLTELRKSRGIPIVEDCTSRPNESGLFWGAALIDAAAGSWTGHNWLGRLWMEIREELLA